MIFIQLSQHYQNGSEKPNVPFKVPFRKRNLKEIRTEKRRMDAVFAILIHLSSFVSLQAKQDVLV